MTRKDVLQDLHIAVKKHLMKRVSADTAIWVATNVTCRVAQNPKMTIEDIKRLCDEFIYKG